jgi:IS4 transposase
MDADDRSQIALLRTEMSGKLDLTNAKVERLVDEVRRFNDDHERRVRALEKWKFAIPASAVLVIAAFLGGKVG